MEKFLDNIFRTSSSQKSWGMCSILRLMDSKYEQKGIRGRQQQSRPNYGNSGCGVSNILRKSFKVEVALKQKKSENGPFSGENLYFVHICSVFMILNRDIKIMFHYFFTNFPFH